MTPLERLTKLNEMLQDPASKKREYQAPLLSQARHDVAEIVKGFAALPPSNPPGAECCKGLAPESECACMRSDWQARLVANPPAVCKDCDGSGEIFRGIGGPDDPERCHVCDGTGEQSPGDVREKVLDPYTVEKCAQVAERYLYSQWQGGTVAKMIAETIYALASPKDAAATAVGAHQRGDAT